MKINVATTSSARTFEGAKAEPAKPLQALRRQVLTCLLWENTFYETGSQIAEEIAALVPQCKPSEVVELGLEARGKFGLRHVPLYLAVQLAKTKGNGPYVERLLTGCIQRADELTEALALYWKDQPEASVAAGFKRGLAAAFGRFNGYQLAKYNRDGAVKLRDVLFLTHPKPESAEQAALWNHLADQTLPTPDTWEVALSAGADKKATFERLMQEGKLGGMAVLRNLRGMLAAGVETSLIRERLAAGCGRAFPYRFVVAAKHAPSLEDAIEQAMWVALEGMERLPGRTGLLVDVSGSMDVAISSKSPDTSRIDVAAGLAIMLRELCDEVGVATFSANAVVVPPRRGFALRDAIHSSQSHGSTEFDRACITLHTPWSNLDRMIVITDEQAHGSIPQAWAPHSYIVNVAPYRNGIGRDAGWTKIDGWSEQVISYIQAAEKEH